MDCLAEDTVLGFVGGRLSPEQAAHVDEHIESCPSCRRLIVLANRTSQQTPELDATIAAGSVPASDAAGDVGERIGRYRVLDKLGQGGMGVVYAAYDPELDRRVALKVLRPELAHGDGGLRMQREGRAIAKLSHPNVVAVFDVGTHAGSVFVAMELVDGGSLDTWLRAEPRPWHQVLAIFVQAGHGLAAAHAAGLVHRDFKPANVLVGTDGRARVTDFGLARSPTRSGEPSGSLPRDSSLELTRTGSLVGTPAYMSPEQFDAGPTDERSDQFSFAVSLYEGLYGERPFRGVTMGDLYDRITRGEIAPPPVKSAVPGWLRAVVVRGLAARPEDRHPTLAAMLDALRRDPAARRRTLAAIGGGVAVLGLAGALLVTRGGDGATCTGADRELAGVWDGGRRAEIERAFTATKVAYAGDAFTAVARTLDDYTAGWVAMKTDACEATHVRHEQTEEHQGLRNVCLDERLVELRAMTALLAKADDDTVKNAVRAVSALNPLAQCADLSALTARVPPPADAATRARVDSVRARLAEVRARGEAGKYKEAAAAAATLATEAGAIGYRPLHAEALMLAGALDERAGDGKQAEQHLNQAVQAAAAGRDDRTAAIAWIHLVRVVGLELARKDDAMTTIGHATAALERIGGDPLEQASLDLYAGLVLEEFGKYAEAHAKYVHALATREKLLPADALAIAGALTQLGLVENELGKLTDARAHLERALAIREQALGGKHPEVAAAVHNLGNAQFNLGDIAAAEASFRRALAIREQALEPDHPEIAKSLVNLAVVQRHQRKYPEAIAMLERALAINEKRLGPDHPSLASTLYNLATIYLVEENWDAAAKPLERGLAIMIKARGPEHPDIAAFLGTLGQIYGGQKRWDDALVQMKRALAIDTKAFGRDHASTASDYDQIGDLYLHQNKHADALDAYKQALAIKEKVLGPDHGELAGTLANLGRTLRSLNRDGDALAMYVRALAIDERVLGKDHPDLVFELAGLGELARKLGKLDEAIAYLERGLALRDVEVHAQGVANARWALGQALWDARRDRARARKLVVEARPDYDKRGDQAGLAAVDRWLATHR